MATLVPTRNPKQYSMNAGEDWQVLTDKWRKIEKELQAESAKVKSTDKNLDGALIRFPVADGYAIYRVVSTRPLKIEHIPLWDAYAVHPAMIRGLNLEDVRQQLKFAEFWASR